MRSTIRVKAPRGITAAPGIVIVALVAVVSLLVFAGSAAADFGLVPGSFSVPMTNANGTTVTQAGTHPYAITTNFSVNTTPSGTTDGNIKDINVATPPGLVGDPNATPQCTMAEFTKSVFGGINLNACPAATQIGVERVKLNSPPQAEPLSGSGTPVFNLVPPPGVPAEFGFKIESFIVLLTPSVRPGDYGLT